MKVNLQLIPNIFSLDLICFIEYLYVNQISVKIKTSFRLIYGFVIILAVTGLSSCTKNTINTGTGKAEFSLNQHLQLCAQEEALYGLI